jgi:hypothetical protein
MAPFREAYGEVVRKPPVEKSLKSMVRGPVNAVIRQERRHGRRLAAKARHLENTIKMPEGKIKRFPKYNVHLSSESIGILRKSIQHGKIKIDEHRIGTLFPISLYAVKLATPQDHEKVLGELRDADVLTGLIRHASGSVPPESYDYLRRAMSEPHKIPRFVAEKTGRGLRGKLRSLNVGNLAPDTIVIPFKPEELLTKSEESLSDLREYEDRLEEAREQKKVADSTLTSTVSRQMRLKTGSDRLFGLIDAGAVNPQALLMVAKDPDLLERLVDSMLKEKEIAEAMNSLGRKITEPDMKRVLNGNYRAAQEEEEVSAEVEATPGKHSVKPEPEPDGWNPKWNVKMPRFHSYLKNRGALKGNAWRFLVRASKSGKISGSPHDVELILFLANLIGVPVKGAVVSGSTTTLSKEQRGELAKRLSYYEEVWLPNLPEGQ